MISNLTGRLVIASPYLTDDNFMRSVIFMIRHDDEGAFGLVINRPTERRLSELMEWSDKPDKAREDDQIYRGGPVEGPLVALHDLAGIGEPCPPPESQADDAGVKTTVHKNPAQPWGSMSIDLGNASTWITSNDEHLRILLRRPDAQVRFVAHYSGWGAGQLEHEFEVGGWLAGEASQDILFGDPNLIWEQSVKQCGHDILTEIAPGVQVGDPNLN